MEAHLLPIYRAFSVLDAGRGDGGIAVSEVFSYLDGVGVRDDELRELYLACVQAMDAVIGKHRQERRRGSSTSHPHGTHARRPAPGRSHR